MASIVGIGISIPEKILTNADLERMVATSNDWIVERTGIRERRIASKDQSASDMGADAALKALKEAKMDVKEIDLMIVATMSPDMLSPSTSCLIQRKIGVSNAACFDVNAACSGFLYATNVARCMMEAGPYRNALVIGVEKLSSIVDWTDRGTCILFGDGAGATVLKNTKEGHEILGVYLGADGTGSDLLKMPAGGSLLPATHQTVDEKLHTLKMDGREVFKRAIDMMSKVCLEALEKCHLKMEDIKLFVPHQANKRIIDAVAKRLNFPYEKIFLNVDRYGNTSAASIIIGLEEARQKGLIQKGDYVLMAAFGAGFTWGGSIIRW